MPIYAPGLRQGNRLKNTKRDVVAVLQLTAMVDMFTVLVVFLLQNYAVTDQILPISDKIALPKAEEVKELKPSHTVLLSEGQISLNTKPLGRLAEHTSATQWVFDPLREQMVELIKQAEEGRNSFLSSQLARLSPDKQESEKKAFVRVTIQADENTVFSDVKKVMYTLTTAGIEEMNFAVVKLPKEL